MHSIVRCSLSSLLLLCASCGGGSTGTPCSVPSDCSGGRVCVDGNCRAAAGMDASADAAADSSTVDAT
ncbi:MAG: hypothetical protein GXP55_17265, partial [Deltaproteobacteria bacterium]|nr:hypothetical protein [Deltaproteobacteria bacterium]